MAMWTRSCLTLFSAAFALFTVASAGSMLYTKQNCMALLLGQSPLNASRILAAASLLHDHGLDQRHFLSDDYAASTQQLHHIGLTDPLENFYIYTALHGSESHGPCQGGVCSQTKEGFVCENDLPPRGTGQPSTSNVLSAVVQELAQKVESFGEAMAKAAHAGAAYIRWGREDCPSTSRIVYSGVSAGSYHRDLGGGVNTQCLPTNPIYGRYSDFQWGAIMYASVYKLQDQTAPYPSGYTNGHAPCAVCEATGRSATIQISAHTSCPVGWTTEYHGYLMSANFNLDRRSKWFCFDQDLQSAGEISNYTATNNVYVSGMDCGHTGHSVCPPYFNARELTCVVCSK